MKPALKKDSCHLSISAAVGALAVLTGCATVNPGAYEMTAYDSNGNSPAIQAEHWGLPFLVPSKNIGMPLTDDMAFAYDEYAIPAGKPVTVKMHWQAKHANGAWTPSPAWAARR